MKLDEAITHCEKVAEDCEVHCVRHPEQLAYKEKFFDAKSCAAEHRQLAEWLRDYKRLKAIEDSEEIETLKLQVQNWLDSLNNHKVAFKNLGHKTTTLDEHIEVLRTVVVVLERIKA